jgi:hypothetical protein
MADGFKQSEACHIRRELADQFAIAARLYAEAVAVLTQTTHSKTDFERLRNGVREAHDLTEAARAAFEKHVLAHSCGPTA